MQRPSHLGFAIAACIALSGCSGAEGDNAGSEPPLEEQFDRLLVREFWDETVEVATPCEEAAAEMAEQLDAQNVAGSTASANAGLELCRTAWEAQMALEIPQQVGDLTLSHLTLATMECREALNARKKFFEASIDVLEGDTSQWRVSLAQTASNVAQDRTAECTQHFINAGLQL